MTDKLLLDQLLQLSYYNKTQAFINSIHENNTINLNKDCRIVGNICGNNNMELLRFLLEGNNLKVPINLHLDSERALCCAINNKFSQSNVEMVKYLLTSPTLNDHSNLYYEHQGTHLAFEYIFTLHAYESSYPIIDYLTLEFAPSQKDVQVFKLLSKYSDTQELNDRILYNLIQIRDKESDIDYQQELNKTFYLILKKQNYTPKTIDDLTLNYSVKNKDSKVFQNLCEDIYVEKFDAHLANNLIIVLEQEKESYYKRELTNILQEKYPEHYQTYQFKHKLENELSINASKSRLKKI